MSTTAMRPLPAYRSHKVVWALKISAIEPTPDGSAIITPEDAGYDPFPVTADYVRKHEPQPGGYWVQYDTGYTSWSPAEAFDQGYTRFRGLTFGDAIRLLKEGKRVRRDGWQSNLWDAWLALSPGNPALPAEKFWAGPNRDFAESRGGAAEVLPTITIKTADNKILMGWTPMVPDVLAEDWQEVD
jgi:Protein of unknown function (DUF2829)